MVTIYDYGIIVFYFFFVVGVGLVFRRQSKNTSDYFRAGGAMPWWITGASAWIAGFSAWSFTGAAGKVYETGLLVLVLYYSNLVGLLLVYAFTCTRYRRMRVVTWMEAVRLRYGPATEQFYTWLKLPLTLFLSGVGLNSIGVFLSSVFHVDIAPLLIVLGAAVTVVALSGGAWAVLASDFVQMFLVMTITIVSAFLTLRQPQIGGLSGLLHQVPSAHFHWTELARPQVIVLWSLVMLWNGLAAGNNFENATMYLMPKSDRDAKRMVLIPIVGTLIGPLVWFIPAMSATITHPNLAAQFPNLPQPHEAAFVSVCMDVLPQGLLGLLICAMLGATLTSMDAGLNKGAGVFVRSFYLPIVDKSCSEKRLLIVSKLCTLVFGVLIVAIAVLFSRFRTMGLFDLTNLLAARLGAPLLVPLIWGLFYKKTPSWSAWSTVVIGFVMSGIAARITPEQLRQLLSYATSLTPREAGDAMLFVTTALVVGVSSLWWFLTSLFWKYSSPDHRERVETLFTNMATPVEVVTADTKAESYDQIVYKRIGGLCLVFGGFVTLLLLLPNPLIGRLCFLFCGGAMLITGAVLTLLAKRGQRL